METKFLGIDIGGSYIKAVLMDKEGEILERQEMLTGISTSESKDWISNVQNLILSKGDENHVKCGISAPGLANDANTKIVYMPERLLGLEGLDWSDEMGRDIFILNDGHASCIAEYEIDYKNAGVQNLLMLTLGTGVGGGVVLNGELYQGAINRAGHFGHITVDHNGVPTSTRMVGSLEYAMGDFSVSERSNGKFLSVKDLVKAYDNGDTLAAFWWLSSVQKLATGISSLINAFSPEVIVLGGGISSGAGKSLMLPLKEFMSLYEWRPGAHRVKIEQAKLGIFAGAIGAAHFAKLKHTKAEK